jgi:uncharacterized protein YjbJ (UPF0337 family)
MHVAVSRWIEKNKADARARMNWDRLHGKGKQVAGRIKQRWGRWTDDALREIEGRREELMGRIQEAYGVSRDDAARQARARSRPL